MLRINRIQSLAYNDRKQFHTKRKLARNKSNAVVQAAREYKNSYSALIEFSLGSGLKHKKVESISQSRTDPEIESDERVKLSQWRDRFPAPN